MKFGAGSDERESHHYPNVYHRQRFSDGQERLRIGPSRGHIELMLELVECIQEPLRLLYILAEARGGRYQPGRYEAASEMSLEAVESFLKEFADFFESDGRHHLWVVRPGYGTVVYDRHDLIYAYGPLDRFADVLRANGLREGAVEIPATHWHGYHQEFDEPQSQMLSRFRWIHTPLRKGDDA